MSNKSKVKNVTSIAIKLNSISVRELFFKFLFLDICIIAILIGFWCIEGEIQFYGEFVKSAQRTINFYPIETANYKVAWDDGKTLVKEASEFLYNIIKLIKIIGIIEGILLLEELIFGTARIRKILKPLNEIAEAANRLSDMAFDEEKFHNLEDAISKISPVA